MTDESLRLLAQLRDDFTTYAPKALNVRTKSGQIHPFRLNHAQRVIHERLERQRADTGRVRALILKGRQMGCSTYVEGRFYWRTTMNRGVQAFILTHEEEATKNLFRMAQRFHEHCPEVIRPHTGSTNAKELIFDRLDSGYALGTAGNKAVGRSATIQYFHGSEVAYWPHAAEHAAGVLQAIPDADDTEIILESTANGLGNFFHRQWQLAERGESPYIAIFVPWFWDPDYQAEVPEDFRPTPDEGELVARFKLTHAQLAWRRQKIQALSADGSDGEWKFKQEYPCTAAEAFQTSGEDSLISPELAMLARHGKAEAQGPHVIGVDPARFGPDSTALIHRQGRKAWGLERHQGFDTMETAGWVARLLQDDPEIQQAFIDVGGIGAGVVDRLRELGYSRRITAVNFGSKPRNPQAGINRRAEMWGALKQWLSEPPIEIPNDDSLQADMTGPRFTYDSTGRLKLETKEQMRKRNIASPDAADALALTFAEPVAVKSTLRARDLVGQY